MSALSPRRTALRICAAAPFAALTYLFCFDCRSFIYAKLTSLDLKGKKVAIFGLGDSSGYGDNFCDAMDELKECFEKQGASVVGAVSADGYDFEESKSCADGKFVGLACDEDNQPDMSEDRVNAWIDQIKGEGMPL